MIEQLRKRFNEVILELRSCDYLVEKLSRHIDYEEPVDENIANELDNHLRNMKRFIQDAVKEQIYQIEDILDKI